ncbi:MAG: Holliday junction branch migration protein RuvA [Limnochordia bacterium]|jgi:Holliday junction DNA helicase RuvA
MIATLRGQIIARGTEHVVLDVGGIGFMVYVPLSLWERLGETDSTLTLYTYLHVRDDALTLYGFGTREEEGLFRQLITVSGLGPKSALKILSAIDPREFRQAVMTGDMALLTTLPGIGKKTAQRILLELKDKLVDEEIPSLPQGSPGADALAALLALGYSQAEAAAALQKTEGETGDLTVEEMVRRALSHLI